MEVFQGAHLVRLRCAVRQGHYLVAGEDGSVRLTRHGDSVNTAWAVEFVASTHGEHAVLLRGAYGGYLSASNFETHTGGGGPPRTVSVDQRELHVEVPVPASLLWSAACRGMHSFVLPNRAGGYLRANLRYFRWRNDVSVGRDNRSSMTLWAVEVIPYGLRSLTIDITRAQVDDSNDDQEAAPSVEVADHDSEEENNNADIPSVEDADHGSEEENNNADIASMGVAVHGSDINNSNIPSMKNICDLPFDSILEITLKLPSREDILRLASTSRKFWAIICCQEFAAAYYPRKGSLLTPAVAVLDRREVEIVAVSTNGEAHISFDNLDRFGMSIIDSRLGLVLLRHEIIGNFTVYDPTNGRSWLIAQPPGHNGCEFVAASLIPDTEGHYTKVLAFYDRGRASLLQKETAWIASCTFYPTVGCWNVFNHEVDFSLKYLEIKLPSVVAENELHILCYNKFIMSIALTEPHQIRMQKLGFRRQLPIPVHILGTTRDTSLLLLAVQDGDLVIWSYKGMDGQGAVPEYKRYQTFPVLPFIDLSHENKILLTRLLLAFSLETEEFILPYMLPEEDEPERRSLVQFELAWPPRPVIDLA